MTSKSVLTLYAPRIPGWKDVVPTAINAHGGIPLALTYLFPEGVKVFVDAYLEQQVGDNIDLYLNGVVVDVTIVESLTDKLFTVYLPVKALLDGLNKIHYTIRRGSQNIDSSTTLRAWFHKDRPGLKDLEGNDDWHSRLKIGVLPSSVLDDGVDPEQARKGVICTALYPLTRAFDKIRVRCAGESIEHVVTEDEAKSGEPIQIRIGEDVFKEVGDTPKCVVAYTVWDWIGNSVDLDALWSAALELFVSLNGIWFEPPLVSEDPNDASDDPDSIDLGKLAGRPAIAQVHAQRSWLKDDIIELTCTFTSVTGSTEVLILKETVVSAPFIYKLSVPHAHFVAAVGGSATFKYKLLRSGKEVGRSFTTHVDVIGEALIDLPLVTIVDLPGLVVDPLANAAGLVARVEFAQTQTGDQCQLFARPVTADGLPTFTAKPFNANKWVNNTLTIEDLVARHGTVLRLLWELTRSGVKTRSKPTLLTVQKIADGDSRLPTPKVPQALDDKVLDLNKFEGDAEVRVLPWLGIAVGQRVWMRCVGTKNDDAEHVIDLLMEYDVTATDVNTGLAVTLNRDKLMVLKEGSRLKVEVRIAFDKGGVSSGAVLFPVLDLEFRSTHFVSGFEDWEAAAPQRFEQNIPISFNSGITVRVIRNSSRPTYNVQVYKVPGASPPSFGNVVVLADVNAVFRLEFNGVAKKAEVAFSAVHVPGSVVRFGDRKGNIIHSANIPAIGHPAINVQTYTSQSENYISFIEVSVGPEVDGGIWVDNIRWGS